MSMPVNKKMRWYASVKKFVCLHVLKVSWYVYLENVSELIYMLLKQVSLYACVGKSVNYYASILKSE